ncbi:MULTISPECIES: acyl carrier protein [Methylomonas]|uniref:acyl carrier protein n=1 Tax=Methylomonas TaxID=416 RepID=UPI001232AE3B|nr:acyl carrier protein [Methylomonas rhizoryzae]
MNVTHEELIVLLENVGTSVDLAQLKGDELLEEAGVDSLEVMNFLLEVEQKFGVKIPDADIDKLNTLNDVRNYLQQKS